MTAATATIVDFRVREEMAGAVLKEVAALEPAERSEEGPFFRQIMAKAVEGLEELWRNLRKSLEGGVSPSDAATLARILTRSANLVASSLTILAEESPTLDEFRNVTLLRLERIKAQAAALWQVVDLPAPVPEPDRLRSSLEQMERGEGVGAEEMLAELKG